MMFRLLALVAVVWFVFAYLPSQDIRGWLDRTGNTINKHGVKGWVEQVWCGEQGCHPTPPPAPPSQNAIPPNMRDKR